MENFYEEITKIITPFAKDNLDGFVGSFVNFFKDEFLAGIYSICEDHVEDEELREECCAKISLLIEEKLNASSKKTKTKESKTKEPKENTKKMTPRQKFIEENKNKIKDELRAVEATLSMNEVNKEIRRRWNKHEEARDDVYRKYAGDAEPRQKSKYMLFCQEHRPRVKEENPEFSAKEILQHLAALWAEEKENNKDVVEEKPKTKPKKTAAPKKKTAAKKSTTKEVEEEEAVEPPKRKTTKKDAVAEVEEVKEKAKPRKTAAKKSTTKEVVEEEAVEPPKRKTTKKDAVAEVEEAKEKAKPRKTAAPKKKPEVIKEPLEEEPLENEDVYPAEELQTDNYPAEEEYELEIEDMVDEEY